MTDTSSTPTEAPTDQPAPEQPAPQADERDWKSESRKWEARAKENAGAARRLAELEEASKTDLQKATDRAAALERQLQEVQLTAARTEIAAANGLPAEALRGSSREELEAHAEILRTLTQPARGPVVTNPGGTPTNPVADEVAFARGLFGGTT